MLQQLYSYTVSPLGLLCNGSLPKLLLLRYKLNEPYFVFSPIFKSNGKKVYLQLRKFSGHGPTCMMCTAESISRKLDKTNHVCPMSLFTALQVNMREITSSPLTRADPINSSPKHAIFHVSRCRQLYVYTVQHLPLLARGNR